MKLFLKSILALSAAALLFAGCAKEKFADRQAVGGELTDVTFTAQMENGTTTKAVADGDGAGTKVNRCIMEVYYADSLFTRMYAPVSNKQASFTLQLVSNRTYKVAFWADSVANAASEQGLSTDLYYTTNAKGGLQTVALKGTYVGNKDARDAFALCKEYTVAQGGSTFNAVLRRPFAQINVITTDVAIVKKVAALVPDGVDVTLKNVAVKYNVLDSTAVSGEVADLNYIATVYNWDTSKEECTLSMDYIFAEKEKAVVDVDWKATKSGNTDVSHSFTSVPYQRNYRTNIKGALLTTTGQWNVTVDPIWESSKPGEQEIVYDVVADIAGANTVIANELAAGKKEISVKFTSQPNDAGTPGSTSGGITCNSILTTSLPEDGILNVLIEAQTKDLFIGDYVSQTSTDIQTTGTNAAVVNVNVPANSGILKLVINAPTKTVFLNGIQVASAGTITNLDAIVSNNTLVIEKGQAIDTLTIRQGGLKIHGTVNVAVVPDGHGDIYVRDCEGLSQSVYDVLAPYIDIDNGYAGVQDGQKWNIVKGAAPVVAKIGDTKYYVLSKAFDEATTGQTIDLQMNATLSKTITLDKSIAFNMAGYTVNVTAFGSAFVLNENGELNVTNGSFTQGAPWSQGCGDDYCYFIFEMKANSALSLNTVTCADYNTHDGSLIRVNGGGGATISLTNSTFTTDNCVFNSYTVTEQTANTLNVQGCTFQSANNQSLNLYYINATIGKNGETKTQFSGLKGMNAYSGAVANLTEVVASCSGTCVYYAESSEGTLTNCNFTSAGHTIATAGYTDRGQGGSIDVGDIIINGGTYISHGSSNAVFKIWNSGGKITVSSGTFTNDNDGDLVYADSRNSGEAAVGTDSKAELIINGGTVTGNLEFQHMGKMFVHGGIINGRVTLIGDSKPLEADGGTFPYNPAEDDNIKIVEGYKSVANGTDPETWTVVDANPVKNVTKNIGYETLSAAADAASDGDEIRLNANVTETANVLVKDKAITIDLNSNTLDMGNKQFKVEHVVNSTSLSAVIFDDKSTGKAGVINSSAQYFMYFDTNGANACTLNAGTINHSGSNNTFQCYSAIDLTMNGGSIHKTNVTSAGNSIFYLNNGELTINDGEFISEGTNYATVAEINNGTMNVKGGTLKSISTGAQSQCIKGGYSSCNINISGGLLSAYSANQSAYTINNGSSNVVTITGGTLSADTQSTSNRQIIKNVYNTLSSASSITGGTYKVGYKWSGTTKQYVTGIDNGVPSTHQITEIGTEGNQKIYEVTAK